MAKGKMMMGKLKNKMAKKKIIAVSGYFDPLHVVHIRHFEEAKKLEGKLIVILNNDKQAKLKKGFTFMPEKERAKIIKTLKCVDEVVISIDNDMSVCKTLAMIKPDIFAKGGDRTAKNIPEKEICKKLGIKIIEGVGCVRQIHSNQLLKRYSEKLERRQKKQEEEKDKNRG